LRPPGGARHGAAREVSVAIEKLEPGLVKVDGVACVCGRRGLHGPANYHPQTYPANEETQRDLFRAAARNAAYAAGWRGDEGAEGGVLCPGCAAAAVGESNEALRLEQALRSLAQHRPGTSEAERARG
jgi:hypothetical protein